MFPIEFLNAAVDKNLALWTFYNPLTVFFSIAILFPAAYAALSIIERIKESQDKFTRTMWVLLGAVSLSSGTFAMHFIGMQAYMLPISVRYHITLTAFSSGTDYRCCKDRRNFM